MLDSFLEHPFPVRLRDVGTDRHPDAAIFPIGLDDEVGSMALNIRNQVDHATRFIRGLCISNEPGPENVAIEDAALRCREVMTILIVSKKLPTALVIEIAGQRGNDLVALKGLSDRRRIE